MLYDEEQVEVTGPLHWSDNLTVQPGAADLFVGEDHDDLPLIEHHGSEVAGPAFSPDGTRLYVRSLRGRGGSYDDVGMTFEIPGPWRRVQAS